MTVWEDIACPLCGGRDEELLLAVKPELDQPEYRLVSCRACGMGYLNPRPDLASIARFYPEEYEPYQTPVSHRNPWWSRIKQRVEPLVLSHYLGDPPPLDRWYKKALAMLLGPLVRPSRDSLSAVPYQGEGRLLDFGCGSGWFAHRMQRRGWKVSGLDFSPHSARQVTKEFGIPVLVGTLPHPGVEPQSLDMITMGAVLEHVHDPHQVIGAAAKALRPGGALVISVPNLDSWGFRFFGPDWWPLELPRHLLHFTPVTLRRLLEDHGLEVQELRMPGRTGWMRRSLNNDKASHRPRSLGHKLLVKLAGLRVVSSLMTRCTVWSKQADCILMIAKRSQEKASITTKAA